VIRGAGFTNARQVGAENHGGEDTTFIPFDCDRRHDCPICHHDHEHNTWSLSVSASKGVCVANQSERCSKVSLFSEHFLHPFTSTILVDSTAHRPYAKCYLSNTDGSLLYNEATSRFHEFKNQKWGEVPDELVMESVSAFLTEQLLCKELDTVKTWKSVAKKLKLREEGAMERLTFICDQVQKAFNKSGNYTFLVSVLKIMKGMCFASATTFNRKHSLLHFANGVLDLDTREFRDALPDDFNTVTTGYDYSPEVDREAMQLYESFISKIYPDPHHREEAQRIMGSTLTGYNTGKKIYIFTDNGGEFGGNNGKTGMFSLHLESMGEYGMVAKKDFMYDSPSLGGGENASPFMAKLESRRAVLIEELEPSKKLAEGRVKEMTNGTNAMIPVRDMYKTSHLMELTAKIMVGCNHGKFPRFDAYDEALTNRFLPVPHISHFTTDRTKIDPVHHVYLQEEDIGLRVKTMCRMAHMMWCLEGYANFKRMGLGLDTMHPSIAEFKKVLLFKNTPVYAYLGEVMEDTGDIAKDSVEMAAVWDLYKKDKRSNRFLTMEQFESSFKVFVNSRVPNAFQYKRSTGGRQAIVIARGYVIKPQPLLHRGGYGGDSEFNNNNFGASSFM